MTNIVSVETEVDFRETTFSVSGYLNFILRYGGGVGPLSKRKMALAKNPQPFVSLRRFVLDTSDNDAADKVLEKIYTYSGGESTYSVKARKPKKIVDSSELERIKELENSIKCSPLYKTLPAVSIKNSKTGEVICTNTSVQTVAGTNIYMQPNNLSLELYADRNIDAGKVPMYKGSIDIEFSSKTKNKKINILQEITKNPDTLAYLFRWNATWQLTLENKKMNQPFASPADRKKYEDLLKRKLSVFAMTAQFELTSWKPYENRATFTVRFCQASEPRTSITKPGNEGVFMQGSTAGFTDALIRQISKNDSLFFYSIREAPKSLFDLSDPNVIYEFSRGSANAETATQGGTTASPSIAHGSFFLLRSLIIAVVQTFYKETTLLDKETYKNILFDKEKYDKFLLFIDETNMPTEVGTFFSTGMDLRNTFETMTVEFNVFRNFINSFTSKYSKTTFDFFLEKIFSDLVPTILKSSLSSEGGEDRGRYRTIGNENVIFNMSQKNVQSSFGQGYSIRARRINKDFLGKKLAPGASTRPKNKVYHLDSRLDSVPSNINQAGALRLKNITSRTLLRTIFEIADTTQGSFANAMIIDRNDDTESIILNVEEKKRISEMKNSELSKVGIIPINWYNKSDPKDNLSYRVISEGGNSPFSFSAIEHKHRQTIRLTEAGEKPFRRETYNVSFSIASVLGVEPNRVAFSFPPSLFGFDSSDEDLFGFTSVYNCSSVSISYSAEKSYFITNVSAEYQSRLDTRKTELNEAAEVAAKEKEERALKKVYTNERLRKEIVDIRKDKGAHKDLVSKTKRAIEETENKIERLENPSLATRFSESPFAMAAAVPTLWSLNPHAAALATKKISATATSALGRKARLKREKEYLVGLKKQLKTETAHAAKREK